MGADTAPIAPPGTPMPAPRALLGLILASALTAAQDDGRASLDALLEREPIHIGALHQAARLAAGAGDSEQAMEYLHRLADAGFDDALEPADFPTLADRDDYRALALRLDAGAPPVGDAALYAETDCLDVLPEGAAYDAARDRFLVSSGRRRTVIAVDAAGHCLPLGPSGDGGLLAVLGMDVDPARNALWVASAAAPFMRDAGDASPGDTRLSRIDLASGHTVASFTPPRPGLLNDLDLLPDGRIAVTDSLAGTVYLLDPGAASPALRPVLADASFEGPNGILALADGQLLVADFHALWLLDPAQAPTARPRRLATPEGRYLGGIDGLARDRDHVLVIQNLVGHGRVWRFRVDADAGRIEALHLLLRQHPDLRNPTTGAVAGTRFLFVADPNLQTFSEGAVGPAPEGRRGHRILALPLP